MSLIYNFKFDTRYAGQSVHVYDSGQTEVNGSPFTLDEAGDYAYTADAEDRYTGKVANPAVFAGDGYSVVDGELDVPASIAAGGGGVGAAESAYFVGTGPTMTTDGSFQAVTMEADARHGDLPDWASIVAGVITLSDDAGTCAVAGRAGASADFTAATGIPDTGGIFGIAIRLHDSDYVSPQGTSDANGDTVQTATTGIAGGLIFPGECDVALELLADADGSTPISDGVVTPSVAVTVTRLAQSPVLPA